MKLFRHLLGGTEENCQWVYRLRNEPIINFILFIPCIVDNQLATLNQEAREIYQYKDIRVKLHKTNAAIWFNEMCRQLQITPNYISIKVNNIVHFVG
jgi:hypothetical protein